MAIRRLSVQGDSLPLIAQEGFGAGGTIHFSTIGTPAIVKASTRPIMTALTTIIQIATALPIHTIAATGGLDHAKSSTF